MVHDAERRLGDVEPEPRAEPCSIARSARGDVEPHVAVQKTRRIDAAEHEIGIGHGRLRRRRWP